MLEVGQRHPRYVVHTVGLLAGHERRSLGDLNLQAVAQGRIGSVRAVQKSDDLVHLVQRIFGRGLIKLVAADKFGFGVLMRDDIVRIVDQPAVPVGIGQQGFQPRRRKAVHTDFDRRVFGFHGARHLQRQRSAAGRPHGIARIVPVFPIVFVADLPETETAFADDIGVAHHRRRELHHIFARGIKRLGRGPVHRQRGNNDRRIVHARLPAHPDEIVEIDGRPETLAIERITAVAGFRPNIGQLAGDAPRLDVDQTGIELRTGTGQQVYRIRVRENIPVAVFAFVEAYRADTQIPQGLPHRTRPALPAVMVHQHEEIDPDRTAGERFSGCGQIDADLPPGGTRSGRRHEQQQEQNYFSHNALYFNTDKDSGTLRGTLVFFLH